MRPIIPTIIVALTASATLAASAAADPINATGVRTYERTCDNATTYTTFKVGHGASFIAGTDGKFVNLNGGNAAAAQADEVINCDFVQVDGPVKGSTDGTLTSKIVP
jgi:hypothetical protein